MQEGRLETGDRRELRNELGMQCQICSKRAATIHLTEISDGVRTEMHICERCAAEQGIAAQSQISINELLSNLLAAQPTDDELFGHGAQESACPRCGFTLDRLRKEGTLGCPHDYEFFEKTLLPLIEKAHDGKASHCGKVPSRMPQDTKKVLERSGLQRQLDEAVKSEDYELAAKLRDEIKKIE
jgi:protein arginine kinase activator